MDPEFVKITLTFEDGKGLNIGYHSRHDYTKHYFFIEGITEDNGAFYTKRKYIKDESGSVVLFKFYKPKGDRQGEIFVGDGDIIGVSTKPDDDQPTENCHWVEVKTREAAEHVQTYPRS